VKARIFVTPRTREGRLCPALRKRKPRSSRPPRSSVLQWKNRASWGGSGIEIEEIARVEALEMKSVWAGGLDGAPGFGG
jgi:hypothetical protein